MKLISAPLGSWRYRFSGIWSMRCVRSVGQSTAYIVHGSPHIRQRFIRPSAPIPATGWNDSGRAERQFPSTTRVSCARARARCPDPRPSRTARPGMASIYRYASRDLYSTSETRRRTTYIYRTSTAADAGQWLVGYWYIYIYIYIRSGPSTARRHLTHADARRPLCSLARLL